MNTWEKFISEELQSKTSTEKCMFICEYYKHRNNMYGDQGIACSKSCPFRLYGGWCKLYDVNGNLRFEDEIDKIINEEIK